jgi:hypothetical protein
MLSLETTRAVLEERKGCGAGGAGGVIFGWRTTGTGDSSVVEFEEELSSFKVQVQVQVLVLALLGRFSSSK